MPDPHRAPSPSHWSERRRANANPTPHPHPHPNSTSNVTQRRWYEHRSERRHAVDRLRRVSNRLRTPVLAFAFSFWQRDWRVDAQQHVESEARRKWTGLQAEREALETELAGK